MKKYIFAFATLLLLCSSVAAQDSDNGLATTTSIVMLGKTEILHAQWELPKNIEKVEISGTVRLAWVTDTADYIEFFGTWEGNDHHYPITTGNTLKLFNTNKTVYFLHTKQPSLSITSTMPAEATRMSSAEQMNNMSNLISYYVISGSKLGTPVLVNGLIKRLFADDGMNQIGKMATINHTLWSLNSENEQKPLDEAPNILSAPQTICSTPLLTHYVQSFSLPINAISVDGNCLVVVTNDEDYHVECIHTDSTQRNNDCVSLNNQKLEIVDFNGGIYFVHTPTAKLTTRSVVAGRNIVLAIDDEIISWSDSIGAHGTLWSRNISADFLKNSINDYVENLSSNNDWMHLISQNIEYIYNVLDKPTKDQKQHLVSKEKSLETKIKKEKEQRMGNRTNLDFHWGFNNWGTSPINGLMGMSDKGYDLRTSFSSYQLSYNYRVVMTKHFDMHIGLGYESDIYKFREPYVEYADGIFTSNDSIATYRHSSTRYVTRYVQLPIGFGWSTKANRKGMNINLTAIPALGWSSKYTGLKHELYQNGKKTQDQINLKDAIIPYKLDIRLDMDFGGLGVFLQVSTIPLFVEGAKIYPIKIGFML